MAFLGLYPIVVATGLWRKQLMSEGKCSFTVTILRQCKLLKNGRSKEPLIMEYLRRLIMCAMLNNFAIFSDEICYE
jgi:hypothetical protein